MIENTLVKNVVLEHDQKLSEQVPEIDLIVGGHDHKIKPLKDDRIIKTGSNFSQIGSAVLLNVGAKSLLQHMQIETPTQRTTLASELSRLIRDTYQFFGEASQNARYNILGMLTESLSESRSYLRSHETRIGNLVTDAFREQMTRRFQKMGFSESIDIAFCNSGSLQAHKVDFRPGLLSEYDVQNMLLSHNKKLVVARLTGQQIWEALEHAVSAVGNADGGFLQVSGLSYSYRPEAPVVWRLLGVSFRGDPIDLAKTYNVVMEDFMADGADGHESLSQG